MFENFNFTESVLVTASIIAGLIMILVISIGTTKKKKPGKWIITLTIISATILAFCLLSSYILPHEPKKIDSIKTVNYKTHINGKDTTFVVPYDTVFSQHLKEIF